jgi:excisionase family DNA binding protein
MYENNDGQEMEIYTAEEAATLMRCSVATVYRMIAAGRLVAINVGSGSRPRYRITAVDLLELRKLVGGSAPPIQRPAPPTRASLGRPNPDRSF